MITHCKLCDAQFRPKANWCSKCKYSVVLSTTVGSEEDGAIAVESEMITSGNMHFIFYPTFKEANVVNTEEDEWKLIHRLDLEELTPELAKYWQNRLKNFLIFQ